VRDNPWLAVGIVAGFLLICAWIAWAIYVTDEHGARQGLGVLIVWPAILAALALISIPFIWAFRVIGASARSDDEEPVTQPESSDEEETKAEGTEAEAAEAG
jgi:hypothetical protein